MRSKKKGQGTRNSRWCKSSFFTCRVPEKGEWATEGTNRSPREQRPAEELTSKDAACTRPELLRLLCSRAATELTEISDLDISSAFLQAEEFEREVYVTRGGPV